MPIQNENYIDQNNLELFLPDKLNNKQSVGNNELNQDVNSKNVKRVIFLILLLN